MAAYVRGCFGPGQACLLTKAIELVRRVSDFSQRLLESVLPLSVRAQQGLDYPLKEAASRAVGVEDADGGDGHREGGVVVDLSSNQLASMQVTATLAEGIPVPPTAPAPCDGAHHCGHSGHLGSACGPPRRSCSSAFRRPDAPISHLRRPRRAPRSHRLRRATPWNSWSCPSSCSGFGIAAARSGLDGT